METTVGERNQDDVQRWTTKRKAALVLSLLKGETNIQKAARQHGLTVAELEGALSAGRGERSTSSSQGRRGPAGGADQEAQAENR